MNPRNFAYLVLALLLTGSGFASPVVEISERLPNKAVRPLNWPTRLEWKWILNEEKVAVLIPTLTVNSNEGSIEKAVAKFGKAEIKNGQLVLSLIQTNDSVGIKTSSASPRNLLVRLLLERDEIRVAGCDEAGLSVKQSKKSSAPVFVGIKCSRDREAVQVAITAPENAEWGETDLTESKGKGERWRVYTLKLDPGGRVAERLRFQLKAGAGLAQFEISPKSLKAADSASESVTRRMRAGFGIGAAQLSMTTSTSNPKKTQMAFFSDAAVPVWNFEIGALMKLALPFPSSDTNLNFYHFEANVAYPWEISSGTFLQPSVGFVGLGLDYSPTRATFRHNNVGFGLQLVESFSSQSRLFLGARLSGHLPSGVSKFLAADLGFDFPTSQTWQLGTQLSFQKQTYQDAATSSEFQEILFSLFLRF